jgi:hypothetical protein
MDKSRETSSRVPDATVAAAWQQVDASFERFCLTAGVSALNRLMEQDAVELCGPRYGHKDGKAGHRWGKTQGKIGFHSLPLRRRGAARCRWPGRGCVRATARRWRCQAGRRRRRKTCWAAGR